MENETKTISFGVSNCLGISHCGGVYAEGSGEIELTDEEIQSLVNLIRENGGCTDVEELGLREALPEIYGKLDRAYHDAAYDAEYRHWIIEGYENGYYETPDDLVERCTEELGFASQLKEEDFTDEDGEIDEDDFEYAKEEEFNQWLTDHYNSLSEDEAISFIEKYIGLEVDMSTGVDYVVEIPSEIIALANNGS